MAMLLPSFMARYGMMDFGASTVVGKAPLFTTGFYYLAGTLCSAVAWKFCSWYLCTAGRWFYLLSGIDSG